MSTFEISRRQLVLLVSGGALLGALLFGAGVSVGIWWSQRPRPVAHQATAPIEAEPAPPKVEPEEVPATAEMEEPIPEPEPPPATAELEEPVPVEVEPTSRIAESPAAAATPEEEATAEDLVYELQLALFYTVHDAEPLLAELERRGYEPFVVEVRSSRGLPRYTVRIGSHETFGEARATAERYRAEYGEPVIVRYRSRDRSPPSPAAEEAEVAAAEPLPEDEPRPEAADPGRGKATPEAEPRPRPEEGKALPRPALLPPRWARSPARAEAGEQPAVPERAPGAGRPARTLLDLGRKAIVQEEETPAGERPLRLDALGRDLLPLEKYDQVRLQLLVVLDVQAEERIDLRPDGPPFEVVLAQRRKELVESGRTIVGETLAALGLLYLRFEESAAAELAYSTALELFERHPEDVEAAHVEIVLGQLVRLYRDQERWRKAEELASRLVELRQHRYGQDAVETALAWTQLGLLHSAQGELEQALPAYREALRIQERFFGGEHLEVAIAAHNLATVYQKSGRYDAAEELFLRAIEIKKRTAGPRQLSTARSMRSLAAVYEATGRKEEALALMAQAREIYVRTSGEEDEDLASALAMMARIHLERERLDQAESLCQEVLRLQARGGRESEAGYHVLTYLGTIRRQQQRAPEALEFFRRAARLGDRLYGADGRDSWLARTSLAEVLADQGLLPEAVEAYRSALRAMGSLPQEDPRLRRIVSGYGQVLRASGRDDELAELERRYPSLAGR